MTKPFKPFLRGHFHQAAFFMALGACTLLVIKSFETLAFWATLIYSLSLVSLLGISALYHRINWGPRIRMVMRRLDHAAIYFLIAGTMTPICLLTLPQTSGRNLLIIGWIVAVAGMLLSTVFTHTPKWLNALLYIIAGLMVVPFLPEMAANLGPVNLGLIISGGVVYVLGALAYALKKPDFYPHVFGYHEVFHILVIVGAALHFTVIYSLL